MIFSGFHKKIFSFNHPLYETIFGVDLEYILFDTPMENKFRNDKIITIFIVILEFLFWEYCILIYLLFQT